MCTLSIAIAIAAPVSAQATDPIRVVTYNVWGIRHVSPELDGRMRAIVPALAEHDPDIVALQEVWEPEHGDLLVREFERIGLRHARHYRGDGRKGGLLIASRFPFEEFEYVAFSMGNIGIVPWHVDWMADKGVARVRVMHPTRPFVFANTHLHASYGRRYLSTRLSQANELARSLAGIREPTVLAGDINSRSWELPFRLLAARARLIDAEAGGRVDAILQRGFAVEHRARLFDEPRDVEGESIRLSDHAALLAELSPAIGNTITGNTITEGSPHSQRVITSAGEAIREASAYLARDRRSTHTLAVMIRVSGLGLIALFAIWLRRRKWRHGVGLAVFALGLLYAGFAYMPVTERELAKTAENLVDRTDRAVAP